MRLIFNLGTRRGNVPSIIATLITSGRECRVTMAACGCAKRGWAKYLRQQWTRSRIQRSYKARQPASKARHGQGKVGYQQAAKQSLFWINHGNPGSRTMPVNSITSAAVTARASVQIRRSYRRAPALNIGSTDTDRSEASATQRWAGREDTNREAKQNERRDENEGGSGRSARRIV